MYLQEWASQVHFGEKGGELEHTALPSKMDLHVNGWFATSQIMTYPRLKINIFTIEM